MTLLAPAAGLATERWSPRWALRLGLLALGLAELVLAALLAGRQPVGVPLIAAITAIGVGIAFTQTPATAGAARTAGRAVGAGLGLFNSLRFVGAALGGAVVAVVVGDHGEAAGSYAMVALISGAAAVLALVVTFLGPDPVAAKPLSRNDAA
jgi:predicted MFS family arabinose efflux permease